MQQISLSVESCFMVFSFFTEIIMSLAYDFGSVDQTVINSSFTCMRNIDCADVHKEFTECVHSVQAKLGQTGSCDKQINDTCIIKDLTVHYIILQNYVSLNCSQSCKSSHRRLNLYKENMTSCTMRRNPVNYLHVSCETSSTALASAKSIMF
jgi:predicted amino acid-binding ACT domain protein